MKDVQYIIFRGEVVTLVRGEDDLWRDSLGTVFALRDDTGTADIVTRCGVGLFSLSPKHPLTAACQPHDYMYSSPAFQKFHSRWEADKYLAFLVRQVPWWRWLAQPFFDLAHLFGGRYWENRDTK